MGRIRVLSDNVANKIAAGEVVERPASVVKELLENSLDAGATEIRIEVEGGGRRLIRIADNGGGMLRDDALLAFERHATSKLSRVEDLDAIATLGFRGEALPSIAAVSRLVLETRSPAESTGTRIEIAGGKLLDCSEAALAAGTIITVRDLFFNVPARKKFLRTEQTELAHVAQLVTHYSLAHCDKTFLLTHSGKELLNTTPVAALAERVFQVFGGRTLEETIDLGERRRDAPAFTLRGFVSRPQIQKTNRNSIFLFVNGRLIRDRLLLHALSAAYHNLMPPACYPFALLFLDGPPDEVDVNVHPSKTEVRFHHSSQVHDFVRDAVREALMESRPMAQAPAFSTPQQPAARLPFSEFTQSLENMRFDEARNVLPDLPPPPESAASLPEVTLENPRLDFRGPAIELEPSAVEPLRLPVPDTHGPLPSGAEIDLQCPIADLRPLGQLHSSFILAVAPDGLWIIDQHVAHERVLFESVLRQMAAGQVEQQRLLMPMVLELTPAQEIEYQRIADDLAAAGFETEPFGRRTIAVKAAPAGLAQVAIERALYEILEIAEAELRRVSIDDLRRGIAASVACRAAIKVNMPLDLPKMEWLLRALAATDCPMSCPHGRPVALRYTTRDILRGFHRI
jgi:DNA mismatch repair protein MutL